jgi:O-antigen/teichoic acid export membrane protein
MTGVSDPGSDELGGRVTRGIGWVGVSQILLQVIRTLGAIAVARLLVPEEYGLAMLALVFASFALVFSDLGLGAALVQRPTITDTDRSTAFWIAIASGLLCTGAGVALAAPVASLYGEPDVEPLLAVLSLSFLIVALTSTQQSLLLREMNFRRLEMLSVAGALLGMVAAVLLAALGAGAWAIIGQQLVGAAVTSALMWRASSWRPGLVFSRASARDLLGFSSYLVGHRLLFYFQQNADRFLIGRFLGAASLGVYAVAYNIMIQPAARIAGPVQRVLAPAFARMNEEPARIASTWARATRLVGAIAIPALTGLVVVAPDFVPVVLGEQWLAAVPVLQVLAWVGIIQALQAINVDILIMRDRTATLFKYTIGFCGAHVLAFSLGLQWGILGVAVAYAISTTIVEPFLTVLTARAIGVSPWVFLRSIGGVVQATAGMAGVMLVARLGLVDAEVPAAARLALLIAIGGTTFVALCLWRVPEIAQEVRGLLGRWRPAAAPVPATAER